MHIAIGSDHHGVATRSRIVAHLQSQGHTVEDLGTHSSDSVDYPDFARAVAGQVVAQQVDRGVLICASGLGMAMAANKLPGVRAAACYDEWTAEMSRRHNDANILCLSDDNVGWARNARLVDLFLKTDFDGGRHQRRIDKISGISDGAP